MSEYTPKSESVQAIAAALWRALDDADAPVPTDPAVLSLAARSLLQAIHTDEATASAVAAALDPELGAQRLQYIPGVTCAACCDLAGLEPTAQCRDRSCRMDEPLRLPNGLIAQPGDTIVRHRDGTLSLEPMTLPRKRTL